MFHELPLCTAHMRMRLRESRLYLSVVVQLVLLVSIAIVMRFVDYDWPTLCACACLFVQYVCLAVGGCNAIGYGISQEIKSGLLPFHRLTPMSPDVILLGYVFGMASASYLEGIVWAVAGLVFCVPSHIAPWQYMVISAMIFLSAFYFHLVAAFSTLIVPARLDSKYKAASPSMLLPICFPFIPVDTVFLTPVPLILQLFTPVNMSPDLRDWLLRVHFFHATLPAAFYSLLLLAVFAFLTYVVARYKIAYENRPAFGKRHAILIATVLFAIVVGRTMHYMTRPVAYTVFLSVLLALSLITVSFVLGIVPRRLLIRQHCVRIIEENRRDSWWHDAAPALPAAVALVGVCAAAQYIVYLQLSPALQQMARHPLLVHYGLLMGIAVSLVGLSEACRIRFAKDANSVIAVIVGIWWVFPLFLFFTGSSQLGNLLLGISPLAGLVSACMPASKGNLAPQLVCTSCLVVTTVAAMAAYVSRRQSLLRLMRDLRIAGTSR